MKEYKLIENLLDESMQEEERMLKEIEASVNDPLFMADLTETMESFKTIDNEWWELVEVPSHVPSGLALD